MRAKCTHKNKYHLYLTHEKVHWSNLVRFFSFYFFFPFFYTFHLSRRFECSIALEFITHSHSQIHTHIHIHFIRWDIYVLQFFICDFSFKHMRRMYTCVWKQYKREFKSFFTFSSTNCRNSNFTGFLLIDFIIGKLRMVFHCVFLCIDKLTTIKYIHWKWTFAKSTLGRYEIFRQIEVFCTLGKSTYLFCKNWKAVKAQSFFLYLKPKYFGHPCSFNLNKIPGNMCVSTFRRRFSFESQKQINQKFPEIFWHGHIWYSFLFGQEKYISNIREMRMVARNCFPIWITFFGTIWKPIKSR